jgi:hypothetical protein
VSAHKIIVKAHAHSQLQEADTAIAIVRHEPELRTVLFGKPCHMEPYDIHFDLSSDRPSCTQYVEPHADESGDDFEVTGASISPETMARLEKRRKRAESIEETTPLKEMSGEVEVESELPARVKRARGSGSKVLSAEVLGNILGASCECCVADTS